MLEGIDAAQPGDDFYDRMAEATCRLAAMRRAVVFAYDDERREVRAVGTHGIDITLFEDSAYTAETVGVARRALAEDRVVEVTEHFERELPAEFLPLLEGGRLTCTPMSAGGRWLGVILSDRAAGEPLTEAQSHTLWSLGKVAALASAARQATRRHDQAVQLASRLDLARDLHEQVVQRLFGVSLALSGEGALAPEIRDRCREELQAAMSELRAAIQRPLARGSRATVTTFREEVERLRTRLPSIVVTLAGDGSEVPTSLEPLTQSVLREAVRNARKHAQPASIEVRLETSDGALVMDVINDGVTTRRRGLPGRSSGVGLRLAAFEALEHGGVVEFGAAGEGRWRVRRAVPLGEEG